jgi:hypothetical protein
VAVSVVIDIPGKSLLRGRGSVALPWGELTNCRGWILPTLDKPAAQSTLAKCLLGRERRKGGNLPPPSYYKEAVMSLNLHMHVPVLRFLPRQLAASSLFSTALPKAISAKQQLGMNVPGRCVKGTG